MALITPNRLSKVEFPASLIPEIIEHCSAMTEFAANLSSMGPEICGPSLINLIKALKIISSNAENDTRP